MGLLDLLIKDGWLKTKKIMDAFKKIKRKDFLANDNKNLSEANTALPIGYGQTISQPLTVAFMMELLQPQKGDKILDVGSGSGWTSAILADIVSKKGKVIAVEIIPDLAEFGKNNIAKYNFIKKGIVEYIIGDGFQGYKKESPYDKILASASGDDLPRAWKDQLKIGGKIVCPIKNSIWLFVKKSENEFEQTEYPGFVFVPLVRGK